MTHLLPYHMPQWKYDMPYRHPLAQFMEEIQVDLSALYDDHLVQRAGGHALHALALLLESRGKFSGSQGCYYHCCVTAGKQPTSGLSHTLARYLSHHAFAKSASTAMYLHCAATGSPKDHQAPLLTFHA